MTKPIIIDPSIDTGDVRVTADPLTIETDPLALSMEPAQAMRAAAVRAIQGITAQASPATIKRRKSDGIHSTTLFNATGHLSADLQVAPNAKRDGLEVSAPPDRLHTDSMVAKLLQAAPVLANPLTDPEVVKALEESDARAISVTKKVRR